MMRCPVQVRWLGVVTIAPAREAGHRPAHLPVRIAAFEMPGTGAKLPGMKSKLTKIALGALALAFAFVMLRGGYWLVVSAFNGFEAM